MKDYSKTFLKLSIIYLSIMFFLLSCEQEPYLRVDEIDSIETESNIEEYIEHYFDIASDSYTQPDGEDYFLKPHRWKYGGFNGTEKIDVFFHESFDNINAKNNLISFFSVLDNIIEDELIKFNVVDNINDADIVIVFGHNNFQSIFGGDVNDNWLGQAVTINEQEYEQEYNDDNIVNPDICSIVEGRIWVDTYDELLIKHEFLHVLGFIHTNKNNSIMNHYISLMSNLKDIDEKAIYLKYNNDLVQEVIAVPGATGFPNWLFTNEEYEIHLDNVRLTLENRFNL